MTATTPSQPGFYRPLVVMASYRSRPGTITPGANFKLEFRLANQGQLTAHNVTIAFTASDLIPHGSGGVIAVGQMTPGADRELNQAFTASSGLAGLGAIILEAHINYTDENGTAYSESFSVAVNTTLPQSTSPPSGPARPTPTPTAALRSQMIIQDTRTDVEILQPGTRFILEVQVANVGNADAKRVTMIAGGAAVSPSDPNNPDNPPGSGGISGSGGEFTNFSPLGASNVQSLGDVPAGSSLTARQPMIVNVSTNPGAYSFKISFVYEDDDGDLIVDDQVITLLVYMQPVVDVSFYRDPGPLFAGQPNSLPLQIVNLGRKSVVLGTMRVAAPNGQWMNNTVLIGTLDSGGYFTLDSTLIPDAPGPMDLVVSVDYTDDFNEPQTILRTIPVEILEAPVFEEPPVDWGEGPGMGEPPPFQTETFWQKTLRLLSGLVGLDSGPREPITPDGIPGEPYPLPAQQEGSPLG
jgi:hypothetical protein